LELLIIEKEFLYDHVPGYPQAHASTIDQLRDSTLISAWFAGEREGSPDTAVLFGRKPTRQTWQDIHPLFGHDVNLPHGNAVLKVLTDDENETEVIWLFFVSALPDLHFPDAADNWATFYCRSTDGGKTWDTPKQIGTEPGLWVKNKPLVLRTGELVMPASIPVPHFKRGSCICTLTPGADQWKIHDPIPFGASTGRLTQPSLAQWSDGELQMYLRTRDGRIWRSRSFDDGRTWSPGEPTSLPNPDSGIDTLVLPDGRLLMVYNPTTKGRTPLCISISDDRGTSWYGEYVLENESGEFSYPAIILGIDGLVHVTYTFRRQTICHRWFDPSQLG
jgi:predicted neuraminidase